MVYKTGVLLLLLLVVVQLNRSCAEKLPTETGPSNQISRIAYGWEASVLEYPYMVNIWLKTRKKKGPRQFDCGGTLISRKCILTAAHCMADKYNRRFSNEMFEFYGGNNTKGKGILFPKVESVFFDDYIPFKYDMDVAILKLTEPVKDPNLKTVEIDYSEVNEGETITVAGWGDTEHGRNTTTLKETNITVTNTDECRSLWQLSRYNKIITENMLCAIGSRKEDSCEGDSGGPIIRNGKQIGIVSFGELNCGQAELPAVYTKLSSVRVSKFLRQTIANNC